MNALGLLVMIEAELALPFGTTVLGVPVKLTKIEQADDGGIVEVCRRGAETQRIGVLDLPLPGPTPAGVQHQVPITGNPGVERRGTRGPSHGDVVCADKVMRCRESIRVNGDHGRCTGWRSNSRPG